MEKYFCIHGHFYQPPRENPWLEEIEVQPTASPYHDWNDKIAAECYSPNSASRIIDGKNQILKIINNYQKISFNFGPTLLSWLKKHVPETYSRIIEADKISIQERSGHGNAIAQGYNHIIMPLASNKDQQTQCNWAIRDFEYHFHRKPEGMWLPEAAVNLSVLQTLSEAGILFTILAPHQARRIRKIGADEWMDTGQGNIDPTLAYKCFLSDGRSIVLFFYDAPISFSIAFDRVLQSGDYFVQRIMKGFNDGRVWPQLLNLATDGESYGHHFKFGEMALTYALDYIERNGIAKLTNYGEYLEKQPPKFQVEIFENSSWSCAHGVQRWRANCGCNSGQVSGRHFRWNQEWRQPLREGMDRLKSGLDELFEKSGARYLKNPWAARDAYIGVILDRKQENVEQFLEEHQIKRQDVLSSPGGLGDWGTGGLGEGETRGLGDGEDDSSMGGSSMGEQLIARAGTGACPYDSEQGPEQRTEQGPEQRTEQGPEQRTEQGPEQGPEQRTEQGPEQGPLEERKRNGLIDSCDRERVQAMKLLEMQRCGMLMFTSCGWFFDDISGIETVQILKYAARAIQLAQEVESMETEGETGRGGRSERRRRGEGGACPCPPVPLSPSPLISPSPSPLADMEKVLLDKLAEARSNVPEMGTGADIFKKVVLPSQVDFRRVLAHYAISSLYEDYGHSQEIYSYRVIRKDFEKGEVNSSHLAIGTVSISSLITLETYDAAFAVFHPAGLDIRSYVLTRSGAARQGQAQGPAAPTIHGPAPEGRGQGEGRSFTSEQEIQTVYSEQENQYQKVKQILLTNFVTSDIEGVNRTLAENFGANPFSLGKLFLEERIKITSLISNHILKHFTDTYRNLYREHCQMMEYLQEVEVPIPKGFMVAAEYFLYDEFVNGLRTLSIPAGENSHSRLLGIIQQAEHWQVKLSTQEVELLIRHQLEKRLHLLSNDPASDDLATIHLLFSVADKFRLTLNLWQMQNHFQNLLQNYPGVLRGETGRNVIPSGKLANERIEALRQLGRLLKFNVDR